MTSPLLARRGAVAATGPDAGVAWHYGDPVAEARALAAGAGVVEGSDPRAERLETEAKIAALAKALTETP